MEFTNEQIAQYHSAKHGQRQQLAAEWNVPYNSLRGAMSRLGQPEEAVADPWRELRAEAGLNADRYTEALHMAHGEQNVRDHRAWSCDPYQDVPAPLMVIPVEPLHIPSPNVLVMSDLHSPYTHDVMIKRALHIAKTQFPGVRDVALVGDTFNAGAVSRHGKNNYDTDVPTERKHTGLVLRSIFRHFDRAWISLGNHDERWGLRQESADDLEGLVFGALGKEGAGTCDVRCSNYDYMFIDHAEPLRRWMLVHPQSYSQFGGKTPQEIADLNHINVASAHNHRAGETRSRDNLYDAVDLGAMSSPNLHWYVKRRANRYAKWTLGFAVIYEGYAYAFRDGSTDWARYGCE